MNKLIPLILVSGVAGLTGCGGAATEDEGGGGSSTATTGLDMPTTLSVVTPKESATTTARVMGLNAGYRAVLAALTDPETDYSKDPVNTHVFDKSVESLSTVNMILCMMDQTRASDMVNKGAYIALVNGDKCETGKNQSSSGQSGQSSGSQAVEYEKWTIDSTRADNTSPMIVKIWVPKESGGGSTQTQGGSGPGGGPNPMDEQQILIETTVTEAVSTTNPFGKFTLNFKGVVDGALFNPDAPVGTEVPVMKGALFTVSNDSGKPEFKFIDVMGKAMGGMNANMDFSREESSHVLLDDANGNTGQAMTHAEESFSYNDPDLGPIIQERSDTFAVAFNTANFLRQSSSDDGSGPIQETACTSRTDFNTNVWRYNLYHEVDGKFKGRDVTAGQRVELESGFPFTYDGKFGHVGYWGVWYEGGDLADGTTIQKVDFSTGTSTDYKVNIAPGRLTHRTSTKESLTQYQGYEFNFFGQHPTLTDGGSVPMPLWGQWHITVNSNNNFVVTDTFTWGENGPVSSTTIDNDGDGVSGTPEVPVAATFALNDGQYMWLWSDALGGNITYVHDTSVTPASSRQVTLYSQEHVQPNDTALSAGPVTLYCYENCLKGNLTQTIVNAAVAGTDSVYYPADFDSNSVGTQPYAYTAVVDGGKVIVKDHLNQIVDTLDGTTALDLSALGQDWGISTAEMVTTRLTDETNPWQVFEAADSYRWETGSNQWNKETTVVKVADSSYVSFDQPLEFNYTHSTANDANGGITDEDNDGKFDFEGKKFRLSYGGPGELWGFPWVDDADGRWHASITLADQVSLTYGTYNFVTKGMEKEQTMKAQEVAVCTDSALSVAGLDAALPLPSATEIGTVSFTLADKPAVTSAPAVIEGELQ